MKFLRTLIAFTTDPKGFAERIASGDGADNTGNLSFLAIALSLTLAIELILARVFGLHLPNFITTLVLYLFWGASSLGGYHAFKRVKQTSNVNRVLSCYLYITGTLMLMMSTFRFILFSLTKLVQYDLGIILGIALFMCMTWLALLLITLFDASRLYSKLTLFAAGGILVTIFVTAS